jgi:hypothetical protein
MASVYHIRQERDGYAKRACSMNTRSSGISTPLTGCSGGFADVERIDGKAARRADFWRADTDYRYSISWGILKYEELAGPIARWTPSTGTTPMFRAIRSKH